MYGNFVASHADDKFFRTDNWIGQNGDRFIQQETCPASTTDGRTDCAEARL